jgi:hypothetical protein
VKLLLNTIFRSWLAALMSAIANRQALFLLSVMACRGQAFDAALKKDSAQSWREFIRDHPDDMQIEEAKERLAEVSFAEAKLAHNVVAYRRFLESYPDSSDAAQARLLLEGLRFNTASDKNTTDAYRQFLIDHPDGRHVDEIKARLAVLERAALEMSDDVRNLASMAQSSGPNSAAAQERLDEMAFEKAVSAQRLFLYLKQFPAGKHRDQVRDRLDQMAFEAEIALLKLDAAGQRLTTAERTQRFKRATQGLALEKSKEPRIAALLAPYNLTSLDDVLQNLASSDALERWRAAEELGYFVREVAFERLRLAVREARNFRVRREAFLSLQRWVAALPAPVAEFEIERRRQALSQAVDTPLFLELAVLDDLQQLDAVLAYRKGFESAVPDPFVLWRVMELRLARQQWYSAGLAANQLSGWAKERLSLTEGLEPLQAARELCAQKEALELSNKTLEIVRLQKTEFPEDVEHFWAENSEVLKLALARLRDAEVLLAKNPRPVALCGDNTLSLRLKNVAEERIARIVALPTPLSKEQALALEVLATDAMPGVRSAVQQKRHGQPSKAADH